MAYEVLDNLQQTLVYILKNDDRPIITPVKLEIASIHLQTVVLQKNLKYYPYKQRIIDAAITTHEIIQYLISEEHHLDIGRHIGPRLKGLAKKLESTAGDVVDYVERKARPPTDSLAVGSSSSKGVVVGFDADVKVIKDWVTLESSYTGNGKRRLQVLPIVGAGGIGKTTLAKIVYNDELIMKHFTVYAWFTISQDYSVASIASNLLASMKRTSKERDVESEIPTESLICKHLKNKRYLIVLDDVYSKKAWDDVKMLFPDDSIGSKIIVTTRLQDVAAYVASSTYIHTMRLLDEFDSWNLLKQKVFADEDCPLELEDIGEEIAKNCGGLPLSIVLAAGLLSKNHTRDSWKQIAANGMQTETIICSSYTHLPDDYKACFLYMAGFPEDYEIHVLELINLWIAEGFLKCSNESKSLEEEAEKCLEDLVKRSLVLVTRKKFDGNVKSCSLHDIVRDFCVRQAGKEKIILPVMDYLPTPILRSHFLPRLIKDHPRISATSYDLHLKDSTYGSHTRTIICIPKKGYRPVGFVEKFNFLKVLHVLRRSNNWDWEPGRVFDLIDLTYLASSIPSSIVPSTISRLQNLQTLIIYRSEVRLPVEIWRLLKLRHLIAFSFHPFPHPEEKAIPLENLKTLSRATDFMCSERMVKMVPNIKKLGICFSKKKFDAVYLKCLSQLEKLKLEMHEDFSFKKLDELEMEMEMGMREYILFRQLDVLESRLNELELEVHQGLPSSLLLNEFLEMDGSFLSRLDEMEPDKLGGFLSRQLDKFKTYKLIRYLSRKQNESEQEMDGNFSFTELDGFETEKCGGFSFRRVENILVRDLNHVFPLALRRLTLSGCWLSWSDMKVIGSLPHLQVLKLRNHACRGLRWKTLEGEFGDLRLLSIERSTLRYWRTQGSNVFPRLERIMLHRCPFLSEIPSEIGGLPTLTLIEVDMRNGDLYRSAKKIEEERTNSGNDSFRVRERHS